MVARECYLHHDGLLLPDAAMTFSMRFSRSLQARSSTGLGAFGEVRCLRRIGKKKTRVHKPLGFLMVFRFVECWLFFVEFSVRVLRFNGSGSALDSES